MDARGVTSSEAVDGGPLSGHLLRRSLWWFVAAAVLMAGGAIGSVIVAQAVAGAEVARQHRALGATAADVATELQAAVEAEDSLVATTSGYLLANPYPTSAEFLDWNTAAKTLEFHPDVLALGAAVIVSAEDVSAFAARTAAGRISAGNPSGALVITPPGDRAFYCLVSASLYPDSALAFPEGFDLCSVDAIRAGVVDARDSGLRAYSPYVVGDTVLLSVQSPVYRDGVTPSTVEGRRAALVMMVGSVIDARALFVSALRDHRGVTVSLSRSQDSEIEFFSGVPASGAESVSLDQGNGWTVTTFGAVTEAGISANTAAMALLLGGLLVSGLLAALVFVLGTGRERAVAVAEEGIRDLRHQAFHDLLTGLPNRFLVLDRLEQLLSCSRRHNTGCAVLFLDLDDFKDVNETFGHAVGDQLLVAVAARLESALSESDTIGRLGGDEFVVLTDGGTFQADPELLAECLLEAMREPFTFDHGPSLLITVSIGVAIGARTSPGDLLRDADIALYQAKAAGKNRWEFFDPEIRAQAIHRRDLEFDLRSAIEGEQFKLFYQPIFAVANLTMIGVEALLRWEHPILGLVQPNEFIPILEQNGEINEVGRWVLQEACTQVASWVARGDTLEISVNVSGCQLDQDNIVNDVRTALESSDLDPALLILEVTETALMHNAEDTARRLRALKALGVQIAVDDFGTGYSSLAYLRRFPVDCLKIDQAFINAIDDSSESEALIATFVQLGRALGLRIVAEGVETTYQIDRLRDHQVDNLQGFLLARPLDATTIETNLLDPSRPTRRLRHHLRAVQRRLTQESCPSRVITVGPK